MPKANITACPLPLHSTLPLRRGGYYPRPNGVLVGEMGELACRWMASYISGVLGG